MGNFSILPRMPADAITYSIGDSGQQLIFAPAVIEHFIRHRQRWWQLEAGGQLFARLSNTAIHVELATGPRPTDKRTRTSYVPDRMAEQREIQQLHAQSLHFVGDWHSHSQRRPHASVPDARNIADCVRKSTHDLRGFVLVIVGTERPPTGLAVSLHDGSGNYLLQVAPPTGPDR